MYNYVLFYSLYENSPIFVDLASNFPVQSTGSYVTFQGPDILFSVAVLH